MKWKMVPEEPTAGMQRVFEETAAYPFNTAFTFGYKAMLSAAPSSPAKDGISERDEITRLTAELEQARDRGPGTLYARVAAIGEFSEKHCGHSPYAAKPAELTLMEQFLDYKQRAEAAEQQVAALVEALNQIVDGTEDLVYPFRCAPREVLQDIARKSLSNLPDRAKKIQAVIEAADRLEICIGDMAAIEEGEEHFTWDEIQKTEQAHADAVEKFGKAVRARWNDKTSRDLES